MSNFNTAYRKILEDLEAIDAVKTTTRKGAEITELYDYKFSFSDPGDCIPWCREPSLTYLEDELAWYVSGSLLLEDAVKASKFWEKCSDDGQTVNSNYGYLVFHKKNAHGFAQFEHAMNCLRNNPQSKKAVIVLYSHEHAYISNDNPCTMFIRLRIEEQNKLHITVYMRSSDVYFGLPYDVPFFCFVQFCAVQQLRGSLSRPFGRNLYPYRIFTTQVLL